MQRATMSTAIFTTVFLSTAALFAQTPMPAPRPTAMYSYTNRDGEPNRAMLGVTTGSSGKRDTLGVLVESVTSGSPADKAGIEEGNRIASINGVSLKLTREDAGDSDMAGAMTNRLSREMRKAKPGDDVTLQLWTGGAYKTIKIKTVSAEELSPAKHTMAEFEDRAALGISLTATGSKRDTAGVFVSSVTEDGPAEKAGIGEGDRIASINGVDLKVPREDIGDGSVSGGRVQRLQREVHKLKVGQAADLIVVSGGRSRSVKVTAVKAKDLPHSGNSYMFRIGDDAPLMRTPSVPDLLVMPVMQGAMDRVRSEMQRIKIEMPRISRRIII